jgi:hypothetical protein
MKVFLDLEDTVIDNWHVGNPVNIEPVRFFLKLSDVTEVDIFSFAVWFDHDVADFNKRHKDMLEDLLKVKVAGIPTVDEMMRFDQGLTGIHFENVTEFISLRGKHNAFVNWCLHREAGQHSVLIDDIVPNRVIIDFDTKTKIESINVANISRGLHTTC